MIPVDWFGSIATVGRDLERGRYDCTALTQAMLARIASHDAGINAYLTIFEDRAMQAAQRLDRELSRGKRRGPLHGIPVAIKDIFDFPGHHASGGSRESRSPTGATAALVRRLDDAGAVIVGALNLDELAAGGSGDNAHFGRCCNPWNRAHCSGGSSGGSAAAVAAGLAFASIGSDAGGSIRIPAAFCGIAGLKPSYGRVSRAGALARTWSMDCIGPLARQVEDLALVFNAIIGADADDPTAVAAGPVDMPVAVRPPGRQLRIGYVEALPGSPALAADPNFTRSLGWLEASGHALVAARIAGLERLTELQQVLVKCEAAAMHLDALKDPQSHMSRPVRSVIEGGLDIPAYRYIEALSRRRELLENFVAASLGDLDLLALPVSLPVAPRFSSLNNLDSDEIDAAFSATATFTRFANYLGVPALSLPTGLVDGLPSAIQLVARPFDEALLLGVAAQLETLRGPLPYPGAGRD